MFLFYCSLLISFPTWSAEANLETAARKIARQKNLLAGRVAPGRVVAKIFIGVLAVVGWWACGPEGKVGTPVETAARFSVLRAVGGQSGYDDGMGKTVLICLLSFVLGTVATAAPFLIAGHYAHLDEAARGEETMGPGITTFLGLLASPVGGIVAVAVALWILKRKKANVEPSDSR